MNALSPDRFLGVAKSLRIGAALVLTFSWPFHAFGEKARGDLLQDHIEEALVKAASRARYSIEPNKSAGAPQQAVAYEASNPAQALEAHFLGDELRLRSTIDHGWQLGLQLKAYGYSGRLSAVPPVISRKVKDNRIEYERRFASSKPGLTEWYVNAPGGLEQGFTIFEAPEKRADLGKTGSGRLSLVLQLTGDLGGFTEQDGQVLLLRNKAGEHVATYDHLKAWDASGRELTVRTTISGQDLSLEVEGADTATYPITIDPTFSQVQAFLTAEGFSRAGDFFGWSVAISGDTAIVGAREDSGKGDHSTGSAYIFVRSVVDSATEWKMQQRLTPSDGYASERFGHSVAISGDTAIIGTRNTYVDGRAYIFVRNNGQWTQQRELTASDPPGANGTEGANYNFGTSVSISGDTAIVGAPGYGAYIFVRNNNTWSRQAKLTSADPATSAYFGWSVTIDGSTAVVGDISAAAGDIGSASVYVRSSTGTWPRQTKIIPGDGKPSDRFGYSVALNGNTLVVGSNSVDYPNGALRQAAYVYTRGDGTWPQQAKLSASDVQANDGFGQSVSVSGDTLVVGAFQAAAKNGAAYFFVRNGASWSPAPYPKTTAPGGAAGDSFGFSVAISAGTVVVGAPSHQIGSNYSQGEAYVFEDIDTDGDGLPDDWEKNGVTIDGVFIDLPAMGADPMHKDLFIHTEWLQPDPARPNAPFKPSPQALKMVSDAFRIAPVMNPDGKPGIRVHIDAGMNSVMNPLTGQLWDSLSRTGADDLPYQAATGSSTANVYDWTAIDTIKSMHFGPSKRSAVFHYALFCNTYPGTPPDSSGLSRGIGAADFFVSLGHPNWTPTIPDPKSIGTVMEQAGTFMHELGHNLGLRHGGFEDSPERKPNYLSVMNYNFQTIGLLNSDGRKRSFDYSRAQLALLNENSLDENVGIQDPAMHLTLWKCPYPPGTVGQAYYRIFFPSRALDWNFNGVRDTGVTTSINCDSAVTLLTGFNDWPAIKFDGGGKIGQMAGAGAPDLMTTPQDEPSRDDLLSADPPELIAEEGTAPHDVVTLSTQAGEAPLSVSFDGSASTAVAGTIVSWEWNFGDGTTGSGSNVTHTYTTPGEYDAVLNVTDSNGHVNLVPLLNLVTVTGTASVSGQLLNISTRLRDLPGDNVLIGGFIVTGTEPKKVIIRGIGPSLGSAGLQGVLADPTLELHQGGNTIATNDNWKEHQAEVEATTIPPANDLESAIVATLDPGAYTAVLAGKDQTSGIGLIEVYDLAPLANARLANISTRGFVDSGDSVMIGGFIVGGTSGGSTKVIARAIGPSLPIAGNLGDPVLELHDSNGALVGANDNWRSDQEADIIATTIPPGNDAEAAIVATLAPGAYTAIVSGVNGSTGVGLVEVYTLQ